MKVLPDTSMWVEYLRGGLDELDELLRGESVLACGPVVAELQAGIQPARRDEIWLAVGTLPWAGLDHAAWRQVGEAVFDLRRGGTPVPLTDVAIAVAAVRAHASVWTRDRDFERICEVLPSLELFEPGSEGEP